MFSESAPSEAVVGWTEVDLLRDAATRLKRTDMHSGAGHALKQAEEGGERAKKAMETPLASTTKKGLHSARATAAAWLLNNVAFIHHDVGYHTEAYGYWYLALEAAKDANNLSLQARVLGQQSRQHISIGNPPAAIVDLSRAIEGDRHGELTATDLAMLHALRARAYGAMGNRQGTLDDVEAADTYMFAQREPDDAADRPWIAHYDVAHHRGDTGAAMRSLVRHGFAHVARALGDYECSLDDTADGNERSKILVCGSLAHLHLTDGDPDRGFDLGHDTLSLVAVHRMKSRRVVDRIERLHSALDDHKTPKAGHLREHIVETMRLVS